MSINTIKLKISGITNGGLNTAFEMRDVLTDITDTFSGATGNTINHLGEYTVDTLPTGVVGNTAYVTDAITPTYLSTLTGGGNIYCPVFRNLTVWVSH